MTTNSQPNRFYALFTSMSNREINNTLLSWQYTTIQYQDRDALREALVFDDSGWTVVDIADMLVANYDDPRTNMVTWRCMAIACIKKYIAHFG